MDHLKLTRVSKRGRFSTHSYHGAVYATVFNSANVLKSDQIAVEVTHSTGTGAFKNVIEHKSPLITITFAEGAVWSGSFRELQNVIETGIEAAEALNYAISSEYDRDEESRNFEPDTLSKWESIVNKVIKKG
jgi:hypothetical protein